MKKTTLMAALTLLLIFTTVASGFILPPHTGQGNQAGDWEPIEYTKPSYVVVHEHPGIMPAAVTITAFYSIYNAVKFAEEIKKGGRRVFGIYLIGKELK